MTAQRLVIRVEQQAISGIEDAVSIQPVGQDECFKKPRGVRKVPLRGTGVRHRLQHRVFFRERLDQMQAPRAHLLKPLPESGSRLSRHRTGQMGCHRNLRIEYTRPQGAGSRSDAVANFSGSSDFSESRQCCAMESIASECGQRDTSPNHPFQRRNFTEPGSTNRGGVCADLVCYWLFSPYARSAISGWLLTKTHRVKLKSKSLPWKRLRCTG